MKKIINAGLIVGRHTLPVSEYIITQEIPNNWLDEKEIDKLKLFSNLQTCIFMKKHRNTDINLYLTGLSRVQHLVINILLKHRFKINLYDFDRKTEKFFKILELKK